MDWEDRPAEAAGHDRRTAWKRFAIKELEARIAALEAEIVRVGEELARKKAHEAAAAALFKS